MGRITSIDEVMDGGEYVCSSSRRFVAANYGAAGGHGDSFLMDRSNSRMSVRHGYTPAAPDKTRNITSSTSAPSDAGGPGNKPGSGR